MSRASDEPGCSRRTRCARCRSALEIVEGGDGEPGRRAGFVPSDEDIHTAIERRVTELAGARRRQAAHRPEPQRPGRHRPAAVDRRPAAWRGPGARGRPAAALLRTAGPRRGRRLPPGLHAPPAGAARAARPPPAGARLGARRATSSGWRTRGGAADSRRWAPARSPAPPAARPRPRRGRARLRAAVPTTRSTPSSDRDFVAEAVFAVALVGSAPVADRRGARAVVDRRSSASSPSTTRTPPARR